MTLISDLAEIDLDDSTQWAEFRNQGLSWIS